MLGFQLGATVTTPRGTAQSNMDFLTVLSDYDVGKMNLQLKANEENQDRAQCGKNEAGVMISFVSRARKHMGNGAAEDRSDDAEQDRPEDR